MPFIGMDPFTNVNLQDGQSSSIWEGLGNKLTGDKDYERDVLLNKYNNAFNSAEAAKNRDWQSEQAAITRAFNSAEAQKQRDYEERLANTQYSRAAADLKSLGLNPAMVLGGASAAAPSGASASSGIPSGYAAHSANATRGRSGDGWSSLIGLLGTVFIAGSNIAKSAMTSKSLNDLNVTKSSLNIAKENLVNQKLRNLHWEEWKRLHR